MAPLKGVTQGKMMTSRKPHLIETDAFGFEFLSELAERESWRKEIHRPIYHVHKWWANRLGSVFRGILLGCALPENTVDLETAFYSRHDFSSLTVLDPFMGSGTTIGEAHKLGFTALGRDINPVAVQQVRVAVGPLHRTQLELEFRHLTEGVGRTIRQLYQSTDRGGVPAEALYYFWVMQAPCTGCSSAVDLFPSYIIARNAYPHRKPDIQVVCPSCGIISKGTHGATTVHCSCGVSFDPEAASASGPNATCPKCQSRFLIKDALGGRRPRFRLYAKLVLTQEGTKEYLKATDEDVAAYARCSVALAQLDAELPALRLLDGYNTRQAIGYGFRAWQDFFNDRQLLALSLLRAAILEIADATVRDALFLLFSGTLEFNNMFASYKGEGTGAVRHMFAHHILKPERVPIEANVWGTNKSSGSFSTLYRSRLCRALNYREAPTEVLSSRRASDHATSPAFTMNLAPWGLPLKPRSIAISCGDSSSTSLPSQSIDLVVTDPPFFDNVHYSELADFFHAWWPDGNRTTRAPQEVQDSDAGHFTSKLTSVLAEAARILKPEGMLVFTYHHSRSEGWEALAKAVLSAGFVVVNAHPVKSEMSVAAPKARAKAPIQLDIILVCRHADTVDESMNPTEAMVVAERKIQRLRQIGLLLSSNDERVVRFGQALTTLRNVDDVHQLKDILPDSSTLTSVDG